MNAPAPFLRHAANVQALQLTTAADLHVAHVWVEAHGVMAAIHGDELVLWNHLGARVTGRLGQWLVLEANGAFDIRDDGAFHGERAEFTRVLQTHSARS